MARYINNTFEDYSNVDEFINTKSGYLKDHIYKKILQNLNNLFKFFESNLEDYININDYSIYTGISGVAFLFFHLDKVLPKNIITSDNLLDKSLSYLEKVLKYLNNKKYSFICGDSGPIALSAVIYHIKGNNEECNKMLKLLKLNINDISNINIELSDELLYGRAGFLFSLLFVKKYIKNNKIISDGDLRHIIDIILKSGIKTAKKEKNIFSQLMYYWHEKIYIGAAHGISGILYILLQSKYLLTQNELNFLIKPTIDFIASLKFKSGNYPSSLGNTNDCLVQWCHGAPGIIHLFSLSYEIFRDINYLNLAKECADIIWERGLLKKGYGLCHGISGNGYAFLKLYQITNDEKYIYRAIKFSEICFDYNNSKYYNSDHPFSLFEGLAGTIYFLSDILNPKNSCFPGFQLN
jgi:lantibiotic modifying enzyme